jgi:2-dehydro-3-deoxyphosphogluconate aldolase / (4S)-4-hydroxy-2-oxoglutarate aldolase
MDEPDFFDLNLATNPVMGIFRGFGPVETVDLCQRAWDFGVQLVEIPVQHPSAMVSLEAAVSAGRAAGRYVGAGTVTSLEQLDSVHKLGAAFTVAPGVNRVVAEASRARGLPHLPGVATSSEIGVAQELGFRWLKAFPAEQLGSGWIRAQLGPFPSVKFIATGGIGPGNVTEFMDAGCHGVAIGSAFTDPESMGLLAKALKEATR